MTKTITKTTLAALALGMAAPAMAATQGDPGATSSGSFNVTANVLANVSDHVQVDGLEDFILGDVRYDPTSNTYAGGAFDRNIYSTGQRVCFKKNSPGPVRVQFTITPSGDFPTFLMIMRDQDSVQRGNNNGALFWTTNPFPASPATCDDTSGAGVAQLLYTELQIGPDTPPGPVSATVTALLMVE